MPRTKKGAKVFTAMRKEYGSEKGKQVYYASVVSGKLKGAETPGKKSKLAKAMRTHAKKSK